MRLLCCLLFCWLTASVSGQSISGTVRDQQTQQPLSGANIRLQSSALGTTTDINGHFEFRNPSKTTISLIISSVGYCTTDVLVTAQSSELDVVLRPAVVQLNEQTITTTQRAETPDFVRPEFTSVLTKKDIRQRASRTIPEALFGMTGVFLQKTNHGGGSPFVRGLTGQQTLLLVDGIRLNNATFRAGPNQYLTTIDAQSLDQIEVVRSTGSVAYGSDAIGGVVNVLTTSPQFSQKAGFTGRLYGKAMTRDMEYAGRAELGYQSRVVAVLGGFAYRNFGDLIAGTGLGRQTPTGYNQVSGDVKARVQVSNRYVATFAYQDVRQDSVPLYHRVKLENFRFYQFDPQRRQLAYTRLEGFYGMRWLESVQVTGSWQRQIEGRQSQRNGNPTVVSERDGTASTGLTLIARSAPTTYWTIQTGLDYYHDRVGSTRREVNTVTNVVVNRRGLYPDQATMSSLAVYSLHTLTFNKLTLTGGARYNGYTITIPEQTVGEATINPSALVGNAGFSYAVLPAVRLVGSVQSAFRAPNIDDMGTLGIVDFRYETPNSNLKPERSITIEAGIKVRTGRISASLLGYHNRLTDFITRVRVGRDSIQGYPVYLKQNSSESFIQGIEAEAEIEVVRKWLVYGSLTYTYGQNITANEPFRRIPPLNGRVGISYQPATSIWARAELLYARAQARLAQGDKDDNRIQKGGTPAWQIINISAGYRFQQQMTLSAELHNLTNEAYRTHGSGVDGVGRSAWLAVLLSF
ncbi:TonB-dependent receptor [Fibrella aquatilis]|uniref:TonB-dependent receptor n=1 Tax=Fibrella aquatilis TaxID=2817059 RepID=A0A939G2E7_9BACT|nr:TonB-dependent receptor [Fibrella aquatilis]MBO0930814.1 TonB-dependent receptor [Fibrella aquatilis]